MSIIATKEFVMELLKDVIDPEVGLNIVDMGLVYDVRVLGDVIQVEMTLTTPGCPMGPHITGNVKEVLSPIEGLREVEIDLVWAPRWSPDRIAPGAIERLRSGEY